MGNVVFCIDTKPIKTLGFNYLWQDRLGGANCLTDGCESRIFCIDTKPSTFVGYFAIWISGRSDV